MTLVLRFHPAAADELESSWEWYENETPGVGDEFTEEFWRITERLLEWPGIAPRHSIRKPNREVRRAFLHRFPYSVIYEVRADALVIIAVAHGKRRPNYWRARLR